MKKFKKLFACAAASLLFVTMLAGTAFAQEAIPGTIRVGTSLNIRQTGSTSAPVIGSLHNGDTVTVLGTAGGWYRISYGGVTGWVNGHYLAVDATVNVGTSLNVRSAGSAAASVTGRLYDNTLVTIVDSNAENFFEVRYAGGTGWVDGRYLMLGNNFSAGGEAQKAVDAAQRMIGVPYVFGGASASGFDCSGLTMFAYQQMGVTLPHSSSQQATMGVAVSKANLRPGDLVYFDTDGGNNNITHEGIYIGNGMFINAESGLGRVNETSLSNSYWSSVYMGARRIIN